jgi:predicted Fe-S protein YdhL (DUF1289 family)
MKHWNDMTEEEKKAVYADLASHGLHIVNKALVDDWKEMAESRRAQAALKKL